jgi:uroporphyrinogen decarboxylase
MLWCWLCVVVVVVSIDIFLEKQNVFVANSTNGSLVTFLSLFQIKSVYPNVPTVVYIKHSGALIERMAGTGVDVVSLDWTVDMAAGRERVNNGRKLAGIKGPGGVQGNLDPGILMANHETIKERTEEILKKAGPTGHVMNLGHGIEACTPEENAHFFIQTVRNYRHEK